MLGIPAALLLRLGAVIVVAIAAWAAWHELTGHYIAIGEARVQTKWDADVLVRNKAIADQTLLWNSQREKTEVAEHERDQARQKLFDALKPLPPAVAAQHVPGVFVGVLDASRRAANAAGATAEPDPTAARAAAHTEIADASDAESTFGLIAGWFTEVAKVHAECRDRVAQWLLFYRGLQAAQPKGVPQ